MTRLLFPGTFDPFTRGHQDLVERALQFADEVIVAIGENANKQPCFSLDERKAQIADAFGNDPRVSVCSYSGLTTQLAQQVGATAILRGVRSVHDFEYERDMADVNRRLTGIDTVLLMADPKLAAVSSSIVRELIKFGQDVTDFLPEKKAAK